MSAALTGTLFHLRSSHDAGGAERHTSADAGRHDVRHRFRFDVRARLPAVPGDGGRPEESEREQEQPARDRVGSRAEEEPRGEEQLSRGVGRMSKAAGGALQWSVVGQGVRVGQEVRVVV